MNEHRTISKVSRYLEYNDRAKMHPPSSLTSIMERDASFSVSSRKQASVSGRENSL